MIPAQAMTLSSDMIDPLETRSTPKKNESNRLIMAASVHAHNERNN